MKSLAYVSTLALLVTACGGSKTNTNPTNNANNNGADAGTMMNVHDTGVNANVDSGVMHEAMDSGQPEQDSGVIGDTDSGIPGATCLASNDFGALGAISNGTADGFDSIFYRAKLTTDALPDYLSVELYRGYSVFVNGVIPGSFTIGGDDAEYSTCGLCVFVYADSDESQDPPLPTQIYMAKGGTVTITSTVGSLQGTLSNVIFQEVTLEENDDFLLTSVPVPNGCASQIGSASIDAVIVQ